MQNTPEAFRNQLMEGHFNELRVALYYMLAGYHAKVSFDSARYDISLLKEGRPPRKVEVKWDKRAGDSGNLYFEVENTRQRRPSGIMASPADIWCQVVGDGSRALLVPVRALRKFLTEGGFRDVRTGGTDSNSRGYLVPLAALPQARPFYRVVLPTVEEYFGELYRRAFAR